jgi:hypothetical protein
MRANVGSSVNIAIALHAGLLRRKTDTFRIVLAVLGASQRSPLTAQNPIIGRNRSRNNLARRWKRRPTAWAYRKRKRCGFAAGWAYFGPIVDGRSEQRNSRFLIISRVRMPGILVNIFFGFRRLRFLRRHRRRGAEDADHVVFGEPLRKGYVDFRPTVRTVAALPRKTVLHPQHVSVGTRHLNRHRCSSRFGPFRLGVRTPETSRPCPILREYHPVDYHTV